MCTRSLGVDGEVGLWQKPTELVRVGIQMSSPRMSIESIEMSIPAHEHAISFLAHRTPVAIIRSSW